MALTGTLAYLSSSSALAGGRSVITDARESVQLPVLMYHGITKDPSEVSEYTISAETFESDLRWLGDNGFTTVSARQITDYVEKGTALPAKPVLITFDDGYANNYSIAYPLLQKNHTYDMHTAKGERKGASKKSGESQDAYSEALTEDLSKTQDKVLAATGSSPIVFAWPFGEYPMDGSANEILKNMGFKITLISYQKMNQLEKGNPDCLYGLKRFLRTPDFDMNEII